MNQPLPPKKEVALALLERSSVYVHLDPRRPGVVVPQWFKKQERLTLQIGLNMPVPIPDLRLDDEGMSCTLSFNRSPFYCVIPWSAIFALADETQRGMVWPEDIPEELANPALNRPKPEVVRPRRADSEQAGDKADKRPPAKAKKPRKKKDADERPKLVALPQAAAEAKPPKPEAVPSPPTPIRRPAAKPKRELPPYLRVVK